MSLKASLFCSALGAKWIDQQVVTDADLITSRKPDDLSAFNEKMIEAFGESRAAVK
jgi:protease I